MMTFGLCWLMASWRKNSNAKIEIGGIIFIAAIIGDVFIARYLAVAVLGHDF